MPRKKKTADAVTLHTPVDEIVNAHPVAVGWLVKKGVVCMVCGEPFWGTIGELMEKKGIKDPGKLLQELNEFLKTAETE